MEQAQPVNKKSRLQLLLLACAFIIPVLIAKFALTTGFKGEVKTHGGQLLNVDMTYQQIVDDVGVAATDKQHAWRIVYVGDKTCDKRCLDGLYHIQQTYKALGRLQERVSVGLLTSQQHDITAVDDNRLSPDLFSYHVVNAAIPEINEHVVIVDPMGNLVMSYQFTGEKQQNLVKAHDMLLDIKQLLKLSRIG